MCIFKILDHVEPFLPLKKNIVSLGLLALSQNHKTNLDSSLVTPMRLKRTTPG